MINDIKKFIKTVERPDFALYMDLPSFPRNIDVYEILEEARVVEYYISADTSSSSLFEDWYNKNIKNLFL